MNKPYTALAITVGTGKIGYCFVVDGDLMDWGLSVKASKSTQRAQGKVREWIDFYRPDIIVTERLTLHSRKRGQTIRNIQAIEEVCQKADAHHVDVERVQRYDNKYAEIQALAERYPTIAPWAPPKRKLWVSEHNNTVLFESLSLLEETSL